ncbi:histidine phosphatase family protein [Comamonas kerstersii]|uniref:histidine phosphatase family protein n=1 Tax=Comamonas kerstersii TaxID=225992 RepID=UPI001B343857|nr:histidine phosphatase family protein [Comamonas kerstersii]QTW18848.1 histidine phosphatase family protein [Comamonas kerstersii]
MQATRIIAIRHGETAWNVDARIQGHLDIPLNDTGLWQAERAGAALADERLDAIYSSDLQRALSTAQAVGQTTGCPVQPDAGLRERCFGSFEGRTFKEVEAEQPEQALRWRKRDPDFVPDGGGESLAMLRSRIQHTVDRLASQHMGGQIALVAHGGVMDMLYRLATRQDLQAPRTWELHNAAINRLLWTPEGLTLVGWGDVVHLQGQSARDELLS